MNFLISIKIRRYSIIDFQKLRKIKKVHVQILGEMIIDKYIFAKQLENQKGFYACF